MPQIKPPARFNPGTSTVTFRDPAHHAETLPGTKIPNEQHNTSGQNLAGTAGITAAKKFMTYFYQKLR